jgi:sugar transferase (PEP-CTERM/EpsH1 system associated)
MSDLLFLAHRIPYPPNKGDKIRSFNELRWLARRHRVHLGAFVDDPADWSEASRLDEWCASRCLLPIRRGVASARGLAALATGGCFSIGYYRDARLARWMSETARAHRVSGAFVFSSSMAPYAAGLDGVRRVVDFCDLDSEKFRQYAATSGFPQRLLYAREGAALAAAERRLATAYDACLFVSSAEAALFRPDPALGAPTVQVMRNGVDCEYFDPARGGVRPYPAEALPLVFTGAMDYRPNVEAVSWFAREVLPALRRQEPRYAFYVVGANPAREVQTLAELPGVAVTAACVVAPLRVARGVQNKVLEALAMGCTVVATRAAFEGIDPAFGDYAFTADDAAAFAHHVATVAQRPRDSAAGTAGRAFVQRAFSWDASLELLDRHFT